MTFLRNLVIVLIIILKFVFAPIAVFFSKWDKVLHFYIAYALTMLLSIFWSAYFGTMIVIALFIFKEEVYDKILKQGTYDPMDLRWSLFGVMHSMFIYFLLRALNIIK